MPELVMLGDSLTEWGNWHELVPEFRMIGFADDSEDESLRRSNARVRLYLPVDRSTVRTTKSTPISTSTHITRRIRVACQRSYAAPSSQ